MGTAASSLNLEQNPCARALKNAAGASLQQECTKRGPVREGDIAVINQTGPWGLKCHAVIFAICSQWNGGKGKEVHENVVDYFAITILRYNYLAILSGSYSLM